VTIKRFKGVNRATTAEECARLLVTEGYATDPQYAEKLIRIMKENG
jgi:flagellum-specific peptidoglycan hydrolase FlgJ